MSLDKFLLNIIRYFIFCTHKILYNTAIYNYNILLLTICILFKYAMLLTCNVGLLLISTMRKLPRKICLIHKLYVYAYGHI